MSATQSQKAARFRALHDGPGAFVIPNPWDIGSARILAGLGFQALATSSAASACALGRRDGGLTREEALAHARLIVDATDLPVSADLEKGFGDGSCGGNHPTCGRGGTRWLHDRGCDSQPGGSPLRSFIGGRTDCRSRAGGTRPPVFVYADCAGAQFSLCSPQPGRDHQPPASFRTSGSRCAFRPWPA
jgi:Phosphoenolpyruvate phosphomutase